MAALGPNIGRRYFRDYHGRLSLPGSHPPGVRSNSANTWKGGGESLAKQYSGVFLEKIRIDQRMVSLAHPRIAREFLVNIGTIVSEGFVDVLLKRRRLGSVEENFIKQLQIGDLFILAGRVLRLIDTGVNEGLRRTGPTAICRRLPRWNAAKMPLTSGLGARP